MIVRIFAPSVLAKPLNNAQMCEAFLFLWYMATKIPFVKALISFLMFVVCSLCGYSQSSVTGAQQMVAAQRASFNDIISIGELIKSVKEGNVGIKKIAERSGYAFRGRYHDPELNDFYYEDVYYKN